MHQLPERTKVTNDEPLCFFFFNLLKCNVFNIYWLHIAYCIYIINIVGRKLYNIFMEFFMFLKKKILKQYINSNFSKYSLRIVFKYLK